MSSQYLSIIGWFKQKYKRLYLRKYIERKKINVMMELSRERTVNATMIFGVISIIGILSSSTPSVLATETSGSVKLSAGVGESISMTITGNADGTDCTNEGFNSCSTFGNISPNQYATASSLISIYTNSVGGYSLSVKADNHADLQTETGSSIPAGTLTSETGGQGIWSYKTDGTGIKTNWTAMATTDTTIKGTSVYEAEASDTTVTYRLSTSNNQAAGDYSTTLIYTATAPNSTDVKEPTLTINLGEGIYGAQIKTDTLAGESTGLVTISEDGTIRTGTVNINTDKNYYIIPLYESGYTLNTITPTGGTITQDDDNSYGYYYYTPNANVDNIITITGKTLPTEITATSGSNLTAMQSINSSNASSYCPAVPTAVKDSRDDSVYYIQTLADGNCWMLENLRLGGDTAIMLTSADTNLESGETFELPVSGTTCFENISNCDGSGDTNHTGYTVAAINAEYNTTEVIGYGSGRNYIGSYYNYCAASAGTICTETGEDDDSFNICPIGWTVPSGGNVGQFNGIAVTLGATSSTFSGIASTVYRYHLSVPLSGMFTAGDITGLNFGVIMSSTQNHNGINPGYARVMNVFADRISSQAVARRFLGLPVRCVLE